jgi:opacity protein-like surface antigen
MNKVMKLIQMILLLAMTEIHAQNIGDVFGGISYLQTSIKDESSNNLGTFKPTVLGLGLAYVVFDNVSLEANVFNGTSDASLASRLGSVTVQVKNGYSLGIRPFMAFNESWGGYAKLGRQYGTQTLTQPKLVNRTVVTTPIDSSYAHTVYGLGVAYNIDRQWGVSTEYMWSKKGQSENSKNASLGVGLRYKF